MVIPLITVAFVDVFGDATVYDGEVFIDSTTCNKPGGEYSITGCVTNCKNGVSSCAQHVLWRSDI